ncbi:MAG: LLM class flavin-dependent oxidoreductase [Halobacteriota archaeon]|nr:LLM class flavin-dependent oxidoreductase [Halobacteriota archaeon]
MKLGILVTGVVYRHPGILIKTATTLDVLSGERAYLGIGAAWYERESLGLGVPFSPIKERFERLEETLQIAKLMWSGEVEPFDGKHYQLTGPITSPQPISKPHPPILIGGAGRRRPCDLLLNMVMLANSSRWEAPVL